MENDIFDRIMEWKILSPFRPLYLKHKEMLLYLFFGGLAFLVNIGAYALCARGFGINPLLSNIIAWVIALLFAYVTNRVWVFDSKVKRAKGVLIELLLFSAGRLVTLLIEEGMLWVGIDLMHSNDMIVKLIAQIVVIIGNYIISKLIVFRKK